MPKFKYVAMDAKGMETKGSIDAETQAQAVASIRGQGLFPTKISTVGGAGGPAGGAQAKKKNLNIELKFLQSKSVNPKQLCVFTRQLSTLIEAGLPLLRGLRILLKQEKVPGLINALNGMGESVEGGSNFSEALSAYPKIFDNLYINMVRAGEAGGVLDTVLARLAEFMEKAEKIKAKVKSAMVYPVVVLVAALGITSFMLVSVIPKFEEIFSDLMPGKALPPVTEFVIGLSNIMQNQWYFILAGGAVAVVLQKVIGATKKGRYLFDKIKLSTPIFGPLFSKTSIARFARTLGTLMSSGVPVLQALNIVRDTTGNDVVAQAIQGVHDSVKEGDTMALPMESSGVFPGMVVSMVDVGEETGALPEMLLRVANNYDDEVDNAVEGLTSVIEPIMIIMLALIIGTIVIAMFMPLIAIMGGVS